MLGLVLLVACLATVLLAGGRLAALGDLRFRGTRLIVGALAVQVLILVVLRHADKTVLGVVHVATFATAGAWVLANRRIPGLVVIGAGGALNAIAITANDGVMPARPGALEAAGRPVSEEAFRNSAAVAHPHLQWLGDTFGIPAGVPLSNVFSVGDVLILVGALVLLHVASGSRLPALWRRPRGAAA